MPNVDDTKPIDLDAIDTMLPDILRRCALVLADPRSEAGQTSTDLAHAVQAMAPLVAEVRRLTEERDEVFGESLVACAILGADPTAPGYDYLETLRAVVKERNELRVANKAARTEGARAMRDVVVDRLLADPALLSLANEIGAFDPAAVAEPES